MKQWVVGRESWVVAVFDTNATAMDTRITTIPNQTLQTSAIMKFVRILSLISLLISVRRSTAMIAMSYPDTINEDLTLSFTFIMSDQSYP